MRTLTFYSYKGGVGRTLALANVARYLSLLGHRVVALDLDLEAPGLHYKLIPEEPIEAGVVDLIHDFILGVRPPESLGSYVQLIGRTWDEFGELFLFPAGGLPHGSYWRKLAQINWHDLLYSPGALGVSFFWELKERIHQEFEPDFLLIDARTGVTELGGVATAILADDVVCLMAYNRENLEGCRAILRSIVAADRPNDSEPVNVIPVITRIPPDIDSDQEKEIIADARSVLEEPSENLEEALALGKIFVLHSDPDLQSSEEVFFHSSKILSGSKLIPDYLELFSRIKEPGEIDIRAKAWSKSFKDGLAPLVLALLEKSSESLFDPVNED